ncbi:MAG: exodeoxyribonuclease VII large subunit, partial [Planctomycetota bacterium]
MSDDAPTVWDVRANLTAPRRPSAPKAKPAGSDDEPWSVSQFADEADRVLKAGFADDLRLRGEVGEWTVSTAGHGYMTLKDAKARVQTVIYQSKLSRNRFRPEVGDEVIVRGRVNFYGRGGQLSIICDRIDPAGEGAIEAAIRRLREKLANEGLFDASRKLAVPRFPSRVVLVTSPQADALQDALKVLRPFPSVRLALYPVTVQGDAAASSVADAIAHLDATRGGTGRIDAILLIRGGGSREDLRAFDDEAVVRAIAACRIPVVTGIGHDTDVSLSDGVADVHAHTPTQAAR